MLFGTWLGAVRLGDAGVADQHVSYTVVCDRRARAPSSERPRVSYPEQYHHERNHQGRDNQLLQRPPPPVNPDADVERRERLGGLLSFYYREAARGGG